MRANELQALTRDQAIEELNRTFAQIVAARTQAHAEIVHVLERPKTERTADYVLDVVDTYAGTLEVHCGRLAEVNLVHPDAWDGSEPGKRQRANAAALCRIMTESFDLLLFGPPGSKNA